jgi:DNA primase
MIDFAVIKDRVPIGDAVRKLGFPYTEHNGQFRAKCPKCDTDDPRCLVVTPAKGLWYCFASKKGGDVIALHAHIHDIAMKDAAHEIALSFGLAADYKPEPPPEGALEPLAHLDNDHPLVHTIGFPEDVAEQVGIGFASKGLMRGFVAVPIRLHDGRLIGYIGIEDAKLPPSWKL